MSDSRAHISLEVNGRQVAVARHPLTRLAAALREELGLVGTKTGCDAGDCGLCTVLLDGVQVCACLTPLGQTVGRCVTTVEGLAANGQLSPLQKAFHRHGAAQCGICTPGMLMAATDLLVRVPRPDEEAVLDALGGVLCRCTGYRKIVEAVLDVAGMGRRAGTAGIEREGGAVGTRLPKVDGVAKLDGSERFGADVAPADALWLRAVRSPHASATFELGDMAPLQARFPGLVRVLSWEDVPGSKTFGIYPTIKDQPVLAKGAVRFRGEAVVALVGDRETIDTVRDEDVPVVWHPRAPLGDIDAALAPGAPALHPERLDNVLTSGHLLKGDAEAALAAAEVIVEGRWSTSYVEHAYLEPEAGCARRTGDRIEIAGCTQTPYMDRDEIANILGIDPSRVRILPTACGGGFGGKLDLSVQPLIAVAAWLLGRAVRCIYTRPESMAASTKRHPARMAARFGADRDGRLVAVSFAGDFNTGAYASWGPTVADRVPIHATGPYAVPAVEAHSRAIYTNGPISGAFRGFGVPQAALVHEGLMDMLAERLGIDPLELRLRNALDVGDITATGQRLEASAGLRRCIEALRSRWREWRAATETHNKSGGILRRGVGIGCMWYGIGNTSMSNPSVMRVGIDRAGRLTLYNGAQDVGQGSATVMIQICADALGVPPDTFGWVMGDTDRTGDAGKTSASRQTFVSGNAAKLAGKNLRVRILRLANAGEDAEIRLDGPFLRVRDGLRRTREIDLSTLPFEEGQDVLTGTGRFDPPTTKLDENGQGLPYACYGFGAQIVEVAVDMELGTVKPLRIAAAHDVGKAINPTQVEGQIEGGIAQGIGLALMEDYVPGRTENLHDYLIPTIGDVPEIACILIEEAEPLGPFGAKGIGEPALIPTAPAILGAIHHATGARLCHVPATPSRVRAAIRALDRATP